MIELTHTQKQTIGLSYLLDAMRPASAYGRALLAGLPFFTPGQKGALLRELDNIEKTLAARPALEKEYARCEHVMMQVKDIRASIRRCQDGVLGEIDLFEIKRFLLQLAELAGLFSAIDAEAGYEGISLSAQPAALELLDPEGTGVASFYISARYSPALAEARRQKKEAEEALRRAAGEAGTAGAAEAEKAQATAARSAAVEAEQQAEEAVRTDLSRRLRPYVAALLEATDNIARWDLTLQKAALAAACGAVRPQISEGALDLEAMTNPMVADALAEAGQAFTPVSLSLGRGATVITGANMGGKSVVLKTAALNTALCHLGMYVFAQNAAIPLFDHLFMLSEDLEDTARGLSSFGGEIVRFNEIDARAPGTFSLLLLDEFARGTNPEEGAAIVQSVAAYLNEKQDISVLTTHFDQVAAHARAHYQVVGLSGADIPALAAAVAAAPTHRRVEVIAQNMDYGLVQVTKAGQMPRDALNISRLLGLNDEILAETQKKLLTFDNKRIE